VGSRGSAAQAAGAGADDGVASGTRFAGGPDESPGFLLWQVTVTWQRAMASTLAPLGLTHPQFVLLACTWWLSRSGETPNQARVAARAGVEVKTASEVFARLEAKGLITRATDAEDSRAKAVRATPDGEALARRAVALVEDADARFFEGVDTGDVVSLLRRLGRTP
jgi:DNA-binding MarR family transcriptional regulator